MRWQGVCYRGHDPRWAWKPLSGAGAALKGGRFNPTGTPALYLALTIDGLYVEMGHGLAYRISPLTTCDVDVDDLVDLRTADGRRGAGVDRADMACAWEYDVAEHRTPASWRVSARLMADGAAGILTPSFARGARPDMANLVLWTWGPDLPHRVEVYDPGGRLPKNQLSWAGRHALSLFPPVSAT